MDEATAQEKVERERRLCALTYAYLSQDEVWFPKDRPPLPITEMGAPWRRNASRFLKRRARLLELRYSMGEIFAHGAKTLRAVVGEDNGKPVEGGPMLSHFDLMGEHAQDAFDAMMEERASDPAAWLRTTPLYRALIDDLPGEEGSG